jgi:glucokinase
MSKAATTGRLVAGLDLGGTKLLGLIADEHGTIYGRLRKPTAAFGNDAVRDTILDILYELLQLAGEKGSSLEGIAIGAPGYVDTASGVVVEATNLGVRSLRLSEYIEQTFALPTVVLHDAKAAALGETYFGAGSGSSHLAFLNLGTGIAVGLVLGGQIYQGAAGRAGELGHVVMRRDGPLCACGQRGCLEALAAGPALARDARAAIRSGRPSMILQLVDGTIERITAESIAAAARQHDGLALEIVSTAANYLGLAVAGVVNVLDLERVVVGGGLAQMGSLLLDRLASATAAYILDEYKDKLTIVPSALGSDAGALGAVAAFSAVRRAVGGCVRPEWR